jgi:hypothetical protein
MSEANTRPTFVAVRMRINGLAKAHFCLEVSAHFVRVAHRLAGVGLSRLSGKGGAVKLSRDEGESSVERNAHRTRIDGFAYPTFPKLRGPTPKNVGNWVKLTAPVKSSHSVLCCHVDQVERAF